MSLKKISDKKEISRIIKESKKFDDKIGKEHFINDVELVKTIVENIK